MRFNERLSSRVHPLSLRKDRVPERADAREREKKERGEREREREGVRERERETEPGQLQFTKDRY